jgi:hypothetical protein
MEEELSGIEGKVVIVLEVLKVKVVYHVHRFVFEPGTSRLQARRMTAILTNSSCLNITYI